MPAPAAGRATPWGGGPSPAADGHAVVLNYAYGGISVPVVDKKCVPTRGRLAPGSQDSTAEPVMSSTNTRRSGAPGSQKARRLLSKAYRGITSPMRLLPDFIIIGGKKCGTSSLYNYLLEHPNVAGAFRKEVHFFDNRTGGDGTLRYRAYFPTSAYKRHVKRSRGLDLLTGEATPYYLFYPLAPARVLKTVPNVKLIALFRDPVDRAYSHYHHEVRNGTETLSFEEAIEREAERLSGEWEKIGHGAYDSLSHRRYSYLSRGVYVDQLKNWRACFPEEQLLILRSEDLFADTSAVLEMTAGFLGLPAMERENRRRVNKGAYTEAMDEETRGYLIDYFRPHNERLYEYTGRDFGWAR